jgi:hypothetical protein
MSYPQETTMKDQTSRNRGLRRAGALAVAAAAALMATACGSNAPSASGPDPGASVTVAQEVALAQCMRGHGVPEFPDPSPSGGFDLTTTQNGPAGSVDIDNRQVQGAYGACRHLLGGGAPSIAELQGKLQQAQQKQAQELPAMLRFSQCMRSHGVPGFPDPPGSGPAASKSSGGASFNPSAPQVQTAVGVCQHLLPAGAHLTFNSHSSTGATGG